MGYHSAILLTLTPLGPYVLTVVNSLPAPRVATCTEDACGSTEARAGLLRGMLGVTLPLLEGVDRLDEVGPLGAVAADQRQGPLGVAAVRAHAGDDVLRLSLFPSSLEDRLAQPAHGIHAPLNRRAHFQTALILKATLLFAGAGHAGGRHLKHTDHVPRCAGVVVFKRT